MTQTIETWDLCWTKNFRHQLRQTEGLGQPWNFSSQPNSMKALERTNLESRVYALLKS